MFEDIRKGDRVVVRYADGKTDEQTVKTVYKYCFGTDGGVFEKHSGKEKNAPDTVRAIGYADGKNADPDTVNMVLSTLFNAASKEVKQKLTVYYSTVQTWLTDNDLTFADVADLHWHLPFDDAQTKFVTVKFRNGKRRPQRIRL